MRKRSQERGATGSAVDDRYGVHRQAERTHVGDMLTGL
ncbi:hypothetical protein NB713_001342 [Xanthomonas sacchari]|nr:hypothetical protein [Xanthomonas sacchari]MCW0455382.1 hypothetical protein [Xanthomonas sacchari]